MNRSISVLFLLYLLIPFTGQSEVLLSPKNFIKSHLAGDIPKPQFFWLTKDHKSIVTEILGHKPSKLRVSYWLKDSKTVWILDEIGKEQPITVGIAIEKNKILELKVLVYRESRGYEVKHDFFTNQYIGSGISQDLALENQIDGITGATLSVRALNKLARVALYLHKNIGDLVLNAKTTETKE